MICKEIFIAHSSGGWKVQGQGTCTWCPRACGLQTAASHRVLCGSRCLIRTHMVEEQEGSSRPPSKDTNPSPESRTSQSPHLLTYPTGDGFSMRFWGTFRPEPLLCCGVRAAWRHYCSRATAFSSAFAAGGRCRCLCKLGFGARSGDPLGNLSRRNLRL